MSGWEVWSTNSGVVDAAFPRLQELEIRCCPNLVKVSFEALPSMRVLDLIDCGDGVLTSLIHVASAVTKLSIWSISGLSDEVWRGVMDYLGEVEEVSISVCNESEAKASKVLVNLRKLEEEEDGCNQLTSLRILELWRCQNLERCKLPNNIQELDISSCDSIASVSFPIVGGHKLKSLKINACEQLLEKELLNPSMPKLMLEVVYISSWKNLKSINELTCFIHMKNLTIINCENMEVDSFGLWPPKLGFLKIGGLKKPISKMGPQNFPPSLVVLALFGGSAEEDDVSSGSQLSHMLPSSLTELHLWYFGKLESVSMGLQHLTSLQHLYIGNCPKIEDLPETLLPSLLTLQIWECPDNLKEKISRRGSYWPLVSYIPRMNGFRNFSRRANEFLQPNLVGYNKGNMPSSVPLIYHTSKFAFHKYGPPKIVNDGDTVFREVQKASVIGQIKFKTEASCGGNGKEAKTGICDNRSFVDVVHEGIRADEKIKKHKSDEYTKHQDVRKESNDENVRDLKDVRNIVVEDDEIQQLVCLAKESKAERTRGEEYWLHTNKGEGDSVHKRRGGLTWIQQKRDTDNRLGENSGFGKNRSTNTGERVIAGLKVEGKSSDGFKYEERDSSDDDDVCDGKNGVVSSDSVPMNSIRVAGWLKR
ncbi:NB-ARC domains-containing protein [Tanacetum coccineum]